MGSTITHETDFLIIGAGFAGAATAYHLARMTDARILIVEQESTAGVHSSGRNAAIVREHADHPLVQSRVSRGAVFLREGRLAPFNQCGVMIVGEGNDPVDNYFSRTRGTGQWCPDDGTVETSALLQSYLAGQDIRFNTTVLDWQRGSDRFRVRTSQGDIHARILVNAAGPWAGVMGDLPLTPMNRHLFMTTPMAWVQPDWPCVWDGRHKYYFRPESGGLLLCSCDETPASPGAYAEDSRVLEELAEKIERYQPDLGSLSIRTQWVGQRVFSPDRLFVIGFDTRTDDLFHVAGLGGHGVTTSYAVGHLAASLLTHRPEQQDNPFDPGRLLKNQPVRVETC